MLNQVALMGRLTADPELRRTPTNNVSVTTFTLAVNRSYVKQGADRQTDFIDVVAWRNTAEFICKYFKKGQMMAVEGSIQTRSYTDKDGKNRKAFEVLANNVYFTESRNPGSAPTGGFERSEQALPEPSYASGANDDFAPIEDDDDLPF